MVKRFKSSIPLLTDLSIPLCEHVSQYQHQRQHQCQRQNPVDPAGPPSGGTTNPSQAGANTRQPVGWNDPTAGPYQRYGGMDWPNLSHPHAPHAMPQYPPPGYLTQYAPVQPLLPNDAPHGPYHPPPPIAGPSRQPAIDPALLPLPEDDDDDFPPAHKLLPKIAKPASKVAGSRRPAPSKGKGKQKADTPATVSKRKAAGHADNEPAAKRVKRGGRIAGAVNYNDDDIDQLLDLLEDHLPTGGYGWNTVGAAYNEWANSCGRPERTVKSLELKYKQSLINSKAETRDLDDSEIVDVVELSSGSEDEDEDHETDKEDADPPRKDSTNTQRQRATKSKIKKDTEERGPMARRPPADKILQPHPLTTLYRNTSPAVRFTIDNTPTRAPRAPPSDEEGLPRDDTNTDA
ncbi:unnamed protein product [Cyclocybe aegerita]|uniref:Uncharacterized protein n=1 Tax=Cyclocybe aegerita TaxID=1973307 RepID=A0A8S0XN04_CYCAE|nr:unnamed protein product [Cyclocybe aegerita]